MSSAHLGPITIGELFSEQTLDSSLLGLYIRVPVEEEAVNTPSPSVDETATGCSQNLALTLHSPAQGKDVKT